MTISDITITSDVEDESRIGFGDGALLSYTP